MLLKHVLRKKVVPTYPSTIYVHDSILWRTTVRRMSDCFILFSRTWPEYNGYFDSCSWIF